MSEKVIEISKFMFTEYPDCVTPAQLSKMLNIHMTKVYDLLKKNIIKSIKIGSDYKVLKYNVLAFIAKEAQI